jgi:hypothetical protein
MSWSRARCSSSTLSPRSLALALSANLWNALCTSLSAGLRSRNLRSSLRSLPFNRPILGPHLEFREPLLDVVELAHLADLPRLIDRTLPLREYETVPPERGEDGSLPIYSLTPERIRERTTEEVAELREQRERERAERYRWVYGLMGLRVVASRDGSLELTWRAGSEVLGPGEPRPASVELPHRGYAGTALSVSSDSHR